MAKMIVKSIAFNPDSKRHMELLNWVNSEQKNFSSYVRELLAIQYEKKNKKVDDDIFGGQSDIRGMI
jgi:hypothetical protein